MDPVAAERSVTLHRQPGWYRNEIAETVLRSGSKFVSKYFFIALMRAAKIISSFMFVVPITQYCSRCRKYDENSSLSGWVC